jgi:hypothetical protein
MPLRPWSLEHPSQPMQVQGKRKQKFARSSTSLGRRAKVSHLAPALGLPRAAPHLHSTGDVATDPHDRDDIFTFPMTAAGVRPSNRCTS